MTDRDNDSNGILDDGEANPIAAFRQELDSLVINSKPHILMLTMLAEDYKDSKAAEIVDCIEKRLLEVTPDKKLPTLYLIDSICKNLVESSYITLFQRKIIRIFCHTFERADDKTRVLLYKLRQTWNDVFQLEMMHQLDLTVKKIDAGWPVSKSVGKSSDSNARNDASKLNKSAAPPPKSNLPTVKNFDVIGKQFLAKQHEILSMQTQQIELQLKNELLNKMSNGQKSVASRQESPNSSSRNYKNPNSKSINNSNKNEPKRKLSADRSNGGSPAKIKRRGSSIEKTFKNVSPSKLPKKDKSSSKRKSALSPSKPIKKNSISSELPIQLPIAPDDVIPLGSSHHISVSKRSKPDRRSESSPIVAAIKSRRSPPRHRSRSPSTSGPSHPHSHSQLLPNNPIHEQGISKNKTTPNQTTIPAPNIFSQPDMLFNIHNSSDSIDSKSDSNWNSQQANTEAGFAMDRDYRHEFDSFITDATSKLNAGTISSSDHEVMVRKAEQQLYEIQNQNTQGQFTHNAPFSAPPHQMAQPLPPQPLPPQPTAPPASSPCPGLMEPNGSVVLFINNELRRLYYLDNITSVVIKAHPDTPFDQLITWDPARLEPKQVFFAGAATTVFIDQGTPNEQALRLEFNDRVGATFFLHGVGIPQRIMLGLPARELIINGRAYQVAFGGAGINVYLECDNKYHEFRLSDSQPMLKFSDEVRYDLWHRLVHDAKAKAGLAVSVAPNNFDYPHTPVSTPQSVAPFAAIPNVPQMPAPFVPYESVPAPVAPNDQPAFTAPPSYPSDLNSLLSKLTAAGLISNATNNNSNLNNNKKHSAEATAKPSGKSQNSKGHNKRSRKQHQQQQQAPLPKQYLPMDVASFKSPHQFAIDQLYSGTQCTNCSLRFSDDALKEEIVPGEKNKKSRYARHLDWHFRQNRREKTKPASGQSSTSTAVAHRRPWYYSIDLWILYKEVNDDIEEDSAGFFDTNAVNSPPVLTAAGGVATFDFTQFKEFIPEFDAFIESINCDNSASSDIANVCSVVAESGFTDITCTVCNEVLEQKWHEEEEEWRLMNAVRYLSNSDESTSCIYHPLCLKDFLIQQEKDKTNDDSQMNIDNSESFVSKNDTIPALDAVSEVEQQLQDISVPNSDARNVFIPGLDCQVKIAEPETSELTEEKGGLVTDADVELKKENDELIEENATGEAANVVIKEEPDYEVKVIEYEIPIVSLVKSESTDLDELPSEPASIAAAAIDESTCDSTGAMSPKRVVSAETESNSPSSSDKLQPKRGGIVIKMKKLTAAPTSSNATAAPPTTPAFTASQVTAPVSESGNVLARSSDSALDESEHCGLQSRPEHISTSNCDNKVDAADLTDDACTGAPVGPTDGAPLADEQDDEVRPQAGEPAERAKHSDGTVSSASGEISLDSATSAAVNGSSLADEPLSPNSTGVTATEADPTKISIDSTCGDPSEKSTAENYFSRGHETSSLCTIM